MSVFFMPTHTAAVFCTVCFSIFAAYDLPMKKTILFIIPFIIITAAKPQNLPINVDFEKQAEYIRNDTLPYLIETLPAEINTTYSEYNARLFADSVFFFTSLRPETSNDFENLFEEYWSTQIFMSKLTIGGFSTPKALPTVINSQKYFNCNYTFNEARTRLYYSRCLRDNTRPDLQCELWGSEATHGKWSKPKRLTRKINLPGTTATQPFLAEYDDCYLLFFVSNRPGGFGGLDIWYSVFKNDRFGDPINLGSVINTSGDEVTPFYDLQSGTLYFSSTNHLSIGGFDIFSSKGSFSDWQQPENIGVPINSTDNDIYFSVNTWQEGHGFFSSNRPLSANGSDTCCYDIYKFKKIEKKVEADTLSDTLPLKDTVSIEQKIRNILPLTLYFHNDEPNPRSWDSTTNANYKTTLANYVALKETYKSEYSKGMSGTAKENAEKDIENFFRDSVENGFRKLELFVGFLTEELTNGKTVDITVSGFASPLHKADYNMRLSRRRIASFKNFIREYKDGFFTEYIKNGKLTIHENPQGQQRASKYVSDNVNDRKNSVYSIAASLERRIQITEYKTIE